MLPGQHDRLADAHAAPLRRSRTGGALSADARIARLRHAVPGRDVHDGAGSRLGRRPDRDARRTRHRRARRHRVAVVRRQMVLLERRRRSRNGARAPRRRAGRHPRARLVPAAEDAAGRHAQPLPDRAAQGQARQPFDGERRDRARGCACVSDRRNRARLSPDGRHDQHVATVERRARGGAHAARDERGTARGRASRSVRPQA